MFFTTREEWRQWLSGHHGVEDFIWVAISKKKAKVKMLPYHEAVEEALCFGWIDGLMNPFDHEYFIIRFSPRRPRSVWSKVNRERAEKLMSDGKMTPAGLAVIEVSKKNGQWDKAYSFTSEPVIPPDLLEALGTRPGALDNFMYFAMRHRSQYVWYVERAVKPETRERRIAEVVRRAEKNIKPG